jgi:signal transduction histidine kinase/ActR/RegA family two-component response regulator
MHALPTGNPGEQINVLLEEAHAIRVSNLAKSIQLANKALQLSQNIDSQKMVAFSLGRLAFYKMIQAEYPEALSLATESLHIYQNLKEEPGQADALYTIASVYYKTDNLHLGLKYLVDCLTIYRKHNDYLNQAKALKTLGTIYEFFDDIDNAVQAYEDTVTAAQKAGDLNMVSNAYNPLSGLLLNKDEVEKAMEIIETSILLKKQTGDTRGLAFAYYGRGKIYTKTKEFVKAEADFTASLDIHQEMGEKLGLCMTLHKFGVMFLAKGQPQQAKEKLSEALVLGESHKMRMIISRASKLLYEIYKRENDLPQALVYLEKYLDDKEVSQKNQSHQIVNSYSLIHKMEAKAIEDRMQLEKAEIVEKKNQAEYAAKAKQEFLSNMSHEIRTPLNGVITITNLLKERPDAEDQKLLESLKFASNNLLLLINDILDFTKLDTGKVQLELRPTPIHHLLTNIVNTYDGLAREKGLDLNLHIGLDMGVAYELDETKLSQILGNLLSNAIKFTDKGRVELRVEKTGHNAPCDEISFRISDTGIGIPDDFLNEIFDSFTQARSFTTKKQGGSGLGLAIVKKLVNLYGSDIHIETKSGAGSVFHFTLQLKPSVLPNAKQPNQNHSLKGLEVLLAEDNTINILVATKLLSKWGIETDCARNGVEAVARAKEKKYDVILMDIHMPEMNGYDATACIRGAGTPNTDTPVYALTADIMANAPNHHFTGFLRKPIEVDQLFLALSNSVPELHKTKG